MVTRCNGRQRSKRNGVGRSRELAEEDPKVSIKELLQETLKDLHISDLSQRAKVVNHRGVEGCSGDEHCCDSGTAGSVAR
ncbi:hypothetical protein C0J52_04293 [Blattella germanica]|nr:hypothetical protein C0J52_04293 [Blattella germanica]